MSTNCPVQLDRRAGPPDGSNPVPRELGFGQAGCAADEIDERDVTQRRAGAGRAVLTRTNTVPFSTSSRIPATRSLLRSEHRHLVSTLECER